eukprot:2923680-Rhodomonas_salina.6
MTWTCLQRIIDAHRQGKAEAEGFDLTEIEVSPCNPHAGLLRRHQNLGCKTSMRNPTARAAYRATTPLSPVCAVADEQCTSMFAVGDRSLLIGGCTCRVLSRSTRN